MLNNNTQVWWVRTGEVLKKLSEHKAPIMSISFPTTELLCTADPAKLCLWSDFRLSMVQTCSNLLVSGIRLVRFIDTEYCMNSRFFFIYYDSENVS